MDVSVTPLEIGLLYGAALAAGLVDAIAGGGGLLTLPALLGVGLPPHYALGTNKGQSVFGASAALLRFWRAKMVNAEQAKLTFPLGLVGSFLGAALVLLIDPSTLRPIILVLLVAAAAFVAFRPRVEQKQEVKGARARSTTALIALAIATYDGFFGPGTGTFLIVAFVGLLGVPMARASADAKVVNFASNLAAVSLFAWRGLILWQLALPMAAGQFIGGYIGAHLTVKVGDSLVRRVVLAVVLALVVKLGWDMLKSG